MPLRLDGRWVKQRLRELHLTVGDLTEALGRERSVCSKIVNGKVPLPPERAEQLAEVLQVPLLTLLYRAGLTQLGSWGHVVRAPLLSPKDIARLDTGTKPPPGRSSLLVQYPSDSLVAFELPDDSMDRVMPAGSQAVIDLGRRNPAPGDLVVVVIEGRAALRRFHQDERGRWAQPESHNPRHQPTFEPPPLRIIGTAVELRQPSPTAGQQKHAA